PGLWRATDRGYDGPAARAPRRGRAAPRDHAGRRGTRRAEHQPAAALFHGGCSARLQRPRTVERGFEGRRIGRGRPATQGRAGGDGAVEWPPGAAPRGGGRANAPERVGRGSPRRPPTVTVRPRRRDAESRMARPGSAATAVGDERFMRVALTEAAEAALL